MELTPPGRGGVSVLALEGAAAEAALAGLAVRWPVLEPGAAARLVALELAAGLVEEALVLRRADGVLEVHVHGSPPLVARLREHIGGATSLAAPLGFAGRALEGRAAARLVRSGTQAAARVLLAQAEGALRQAFEAWLAGDAATRVRLGAELVRAGQVAELLVEPARVVLAGPVNMGKSTLFNLIVGRERVVVSDEEGTTRDLLEEPARLGAYPIRLVDTAGWRTASGAFGDVEAEGQALGRRALERADWVVWLERGAPGGPGGPGAPGGPRVTAFRALADGGTGARDLAPGTQPAESLERVERAFREAFELPADPWSAAVGRAFPFDAETRALAAGMAGQEKSAGIVAAVESALS